MSAPLAIPARLAFIVVFVVLPVAGILQGVLIRHLTVLPPRRELYSGSILMLWVAAAIAVGLAMLGGLPLPGVLPDRERLEVAAACSAAVVIAGVGIVYAFRAAGVREPHLVDHIMPRTGADRQLFALLSVTAGVTEEWLYRGVAYAALIGLGAQPPLALVVSSAAFGALHYYQRWSGAVRSGLVGLVLGFPVLATGSLLPSMVAHTALDLLLGLVIGPRWRAADGVNEDARDLSGDPA